MRYRPEELLPLVKELSWKYTGKASTSITYEAAQQLMRAVLYCIQEYTLGAEKDELCPGKKVAAREAYELGYELVLKKTQDARKCYNQIAEQFDSYGSRAYEETFRKGIPEFFLWYDARLKPQEHILTLDYPALGNDVKACGIDRIYEYLWSIDKEQQFLSRFPKAYVRAVNRERYPEYEEYFVNVCQTPLRRMLCCMLAEIDLTETEISKEEYLQIEEALYMNEVKAKELKGRLEVALKILVNQIYGGEEELYRYLSRDLDDLAFELKNGIENHCLKEVIG
ncbi:DUF6179 domain-containing protein [Faecalicatena contorta]|uniref:DUF6179 domain-containing protein n=1 Tax=Faecalicatena contorta TaxID=39482 RepID=UPI001F1B7D67|nr:DUF6179 domain-containing protein [Faecalicatena contorta]MCF2683020.1 hypothetical protein [Faecalicatena contorta]